MMVCLLLSAAFNDEQCVLWVYAVLQSIAMQVLLTTPTVALVVLSIKLLLAWLLIRGNAVARARARAKELQRRAFQLAADKARIAARLRLMNANNASPGGEGERSEDDEDDHRHRGPGGGGGGERAKARSSTSKWGLMRMLHRLSASEARLSAQQEKAERAAASNVASLTIGGRSKSKAHLLSLIHI